MTKEKVTSLEVARLAGVSQSAVSRVFTPGASASEATRSKVMKAAEALDYRPNTLARAMITGKSRMIGLVIADLGNQFYPTALELLSRALQKQGYHVLVFLAGGAMDGIEETVQQLMDYQVDGIITASVSISSELTARCKAANIPLVMFNRGQDDAALCSVTTDNIAGGRLAANFLIRGGHKRIAHISGWQEATTGRDRCRGFVEALVDHGMQPAAIADGLYSRERAAEIARELFIGNKHPDAVFVGNDFMAFAVMDVLRFELGLSVPDDVSVVGYDDVPLAAWPAYDLTTIRQPIRRMVDATVETLLAMIEGETARRQVRISGALMIRGSARKLKGQRA